MVSFFLRPPCARVLASPAQQSCGLQTPLALVTVAAAILHLVVPVAAQGLTPEEIQRLVDSGKFNSKPVEPQQGSHPVRASRRPSMALVPIAPVREHVRRIHSCGRLW